MKLNITTLLSLLVALAGIATAYMTGFLEHHPDVMAVFVAVEQIISAWLPKLGNKGVDL